MLTDITLLLILILVNGVFAMSEIAIVGSSAHACCRWPRRGVRAPGTR